MNSQPTWAVPRNRNRNLLIVEGNHEKNELFSILFLCFPELGINPDDIWIYGTNLYQLYEEIERNYGVDWDQLDVDLPFIISAREHMPILCYKRNFVNIFLVFDYERHDPLFHTQKIHKMLKYFSDEGDMGKLFINYPMVESYQHFNKFPDPSYEDLNISVTLRPGIAYKALVRGKHVQKSIEFPQILERHLLELYNVSDPRIYRDRLLAIAKTEDLQEAVWQVLKGSIDKAKFTQVKMHLSDFLNRQGYLEEGLNYWEYMRRVFIQIIRHNICKANKLQGLCYQIPEDTLKQCFRSLDLEAVLIRQNNDSCDPTKKYIWVLNTCVFIVPRYNFSLIEEYTK